MSREKAFTFSQKYAKIEKKNFCGKDNTMTDRERFIDIYTKNIKREGADKLLKLSIEVGSETRQLVAGVAQYYSPEAIIGKTIVIVANLKPAKIRGIESQGMLLAAKDGNNLKLVTIDGDMPSGVSIG